MSSFDRSFPPILHLMQRLDALGWEDLTNGSGGLRGDCA